MDFRHNLFKAMLLNISNDYKDDNYDHYRFGTLRISAGKATSVSLKSIIVKTLNRFNYYNIKGIKTAQVFLVRDLLHFLDKMDGQLHYFEYLYNILESNECKQLLTELVAFRIMGYTKVKLPVNTPAYWSNLKEMDSLIEGDDEIDIHFHHFKLRKFNLREIGYPACGYLNNLGVLSGFLLEQYRYCSNDKSKQIAAEKGDVIIDAGACYGDTALYFACKAGVSGKVYSFEFIQDNIEIFRRNCALNPLLEKNIELVKFPLWSKFGIPIYYSSDGPASRVSSDRIPNASGESITTTIDHFVDERKVRRIDFIKMDIEGAELNALMGAIETIREHRPKLAICLYHRIEDFGEIPRFINELDLGYKFYLGHYTIHKEETVLFAEALA